MPKTYRVKPVVKVLPKVQDLFRIRNLHRELAREFDLRKIGQGMPTTDRVRRLARLEQDFEERYGHRPDIRRLG